MPSGVLVVSAFLVLASPGVGRASGEEGRALMLRPGDLEQGFEFDNIRVPLVGPPGIWKPAALPKMPLSITTVPPTDRKVPPYDDEHRFAVLRRYPYTMVYQVQPDRVYVVAVAQSGRAAGYWQGRT